MKIKLTKEQVEHIVADPEKAQEAGINACQGTGTWHQHLRGGEVPGSVPWHACHPPCHPQNSYFKYS